MNKLSEKLTGTTIRSVNNKEYTLGKMAGYGGQGIVFEEKSGSRMIKLYYPSGSDFIDQTTLERLEFIQKVKMPRNFVEIFDIIEKPFIGYVMEKVKDYKPLNSYLILPKDMDFIAWYNQGLGLRGRLFIGYIIAKAFSEFEKSNLAYCDISGNNILVKIESELSTVSVKMIDIDNIYLSGRKGKASVLGTPRYIAPEVVNRKYNPDVFSDNYSLAVLLFELLRVGHPYISDDILDGTPEDEDKALAGECDYVNEENSTNMLPEKLVLTKKLQELFRKCFVDGKNDRMKRPSAGEFEIALLEASNKIIQCPSCGAWHYPQQAQDWSCPWCDSLSKPQARLNFYDLWVDSDHSPNKKLVNTYILRDNELNRIKNFYILRAENEKASENFMTIAKDQNGYWLYNEFSKAGIAVKPHNATQIVKVDDKNKPYLLKNEDQIYFDIDKDAHITNKGKNYSLFRIARFILENKSDEQKGDSCSSTD